ncbi:MAG: hypothetical protein QM817_36140 [Archangium sp.]
MLLALALLSSTVVQAVDDDDPWLGPDKALHFSFSAGIAITAYAGSMLITDDARVRFALSSGIAIAAGTVKELADLAGILGHPSWKDFAWDLAGTFFGAVASLLLDQLLITPLFAQIPVW